MSSPLRNLKISALSLLALQILLVVTGGLVRLTGSGLGCPTWPKCTADSYKPVQSQPQIHAWIEFGNRLLTFALFASALLTLILVYKSLRRELLYLAWLQVAGIFGQGILGGITVLTKLNPLPVAGHLLLSMCLIAGATSLHYRIDHSVEQDDEAIARSLATIAFLTLIAGTIVTGSGPHAGDWQAKRFPIEIQLAAKYHGTLVAMTLLTAIYIAIKFPRRSVNFLLIVLIGQGLIGLIQWWQGLPQALVGAHLFGAALFWFATWRTRLTFKFKNQKGQI